MCVEQVDTNGTAPPLEAASNQMAWWKQLDMHLLISTYGLIALMYTLVDEVKLLRFCMVCQQWLGLNLWQHHTAQHCCQFQGSHEIYRTKLQSSIAVVDPR